MTSWLVICIIWAAVCFVYLTFKLVWAINPEHQMFNRFPMKLARFALAQRGRVLFLEGGCGRISHAASLAEDQASVMDQDKEICA